MANDEEAETYDEQGVDLTLVRYTLGLSPTERLRALENFMNAMASVKPVPPAAEPDDPRTTDEPRSRID